MLMQILRGTGSLIFLVLTLPMKVVLMLYVIALMIKDVIIARYFTFEEFWEIFMEGFQEGIERELYWIRTGEFR